MFFVRRVLASTSKGLCLKTPQIQIKIPNSALPFCNYHSISSNLLQRLMSEPESCTKPILDSEDLSSLQTFGFSWVSLVSALNSSSSSKANLAIEWRLETLLKLSERNHELFSELISLCGGTRNLELAMRIFLSMESIGLRPTSEVFNSLISVSLSVGNEMNAFCLFDIMERSEEYRPNSKTYNGFISMYARFGNVKLMQAWVAAKGAAGHSADLQSYDSLISGCVKARQSEVAERYYKEMISSGFIPNTNILDKMVDGFCEQRDLGRVREFLLYMIDNGLAISVYMADRVSGLCSKLGKIDGIEEFLQILTKSKGSQEVLSRVHCEIIAMHAKEDRLDDMEYAVGRMLKQGISFKSDDDIKVVIRSYFRRAAYDRLKLFLEHMKSSYQFTKSTYDLLVTGYREAGLSEQLDMLLKDLGLCEIS